MECNEWIRLMLHLISSQWPVGTWQQCTTDAYEQLLADRVFKHFLFESYISWWRRCSCDNELHSTARYQFRYYTSEYLSEGCQTRWRCSACFNVSWLTIFIPMCWSLLLFGLMLYAYITSWLYYLEIRLIQDTYCVELLRQKLALKFFSVLSKKLTRNWGIYYFSLHFCNTLKPNILVSGKNKLYTYVEKRTIFCYFIQKCILINSVLEKNVALPFPWFC